ncbi:hypothetical protein ACI8AF_16345 [Blastococcus sp. SYSU D00669]
MRSVEAASRDDAIAAAREQFGPTARVVGVRRVRSGGVLGFFATERYIAEVDPEAPAAPSTVPSTARSASLDERARVAAESLARLTARTADPVDELADLLGSDTPAEPVPTYTRSAFQRATTESVRRSAVVPAAMAARAMRTGGAEPARSKATAAVPVWPVVDADDEGEVVPETGASAAPSPFTAALARMVSGDREVRQAVQEALAEPAGEQGQDELPRPNWAAIVRAAEKSAQSGAEHPEPGARHQEEEPVDEQGEQSPGVRPMVFPAWAAEAAAPEPAPVPEPAPASSTREEAIADVLRAALAQGQSDEALADLLRTVLAGSSPATALAEPQLPAEPLWSEPSPVQPVFAGTDLGPGHDAAVPADTAESVTVALDLPAETPVDEPIFAEVVLHEPARPAEPVVEEPVAEPVVQAVAEPRVQAVAEPVAVEPEPVVVEPEPVAVEPEPVAEARAELPMPPLARTASDPAPMPLDATTVMSPLSLLPPLSGRRGGLPPVPPAPSRPAPSPAAASASARSVEPTTAPTTAPMAAPAPAAPLARVVRLPFAPLPDVDYVEPAESTVEETPVPQSSAALRFEDDAPAPVRAAAPVAAPAADPVPAAPAPAPAADVAARLTALGVPAGLLGDGFAGAAATSGTYAALTSALAGGLPVAPAVPTGPGEVLFLVGPGVETLRAARSLAATLRLDPERVQWATRGDLAALAAKSSRITTIDAAIERRSDAARAGTMTIVAVDAPLRTDAYWMSQMLAIWSPSAVWAVVEATRKPEDLEQWLGGLPRVDALVVQDSDLSADPAAVLARIDTPVALLDGVPATPHRWASVLCERLETLEA